MTRFVVTLCNGLEHPNRKVKHVPVVADSPDHLRDQVRQIEQEWGMPMTDVTWPSAPGGTRLVANVGEYNTELLEDAFY